MLTVGVFELLTFRGLSGNITLRFEELSSRQFFLPLTCPGPGLLSVDLGDKRNGLWLDNRSPFVIRYPQDA